MKEYFCVVFLVMSTISVAQDKLERIDSEFLDGLITKEADEENYDKTLVLLNKIRKNDSSYCSALLSKTYYLIQLKKYDEVIEIADQGLTDNCGKTKRDFYINKTIALYSQEHYQKAMELVQESLSQYPMSNEFWYYKALILEKLDDKEGATKAYQRSIVLDPFYKRPHLQLGNLAYKQHKFAQALMCFNMYMILDPDGEGVFNTLKSIDAMAKSDNENLVDENFQLSPEDGSFEEIDLILDQRVAIDSEYDTGTGINIATVKQTHALLKMLEDYEGPEGFWSTKYVPFYKWITQSELFNDFVYTLTFSIENEDLKKIVQKKREDVISFVASYREKWQDLVERNVTKVDGVDKVIHYEFNGEYVSAVGQKDQNKPVGHWKTYKTEGHLSAEGDFNNLGEKHGTWTWYHDNGSIKETAVYNNGNLEGENLQFFEDGRKSIIASYSEGKLNGSYSVYNNNGALLQRKFWKEGKLDGPYKSYFPVGEESLEFDVIYKDHEVLGVVKEFYANGNIYAETEYKGGVKSGSEKKYHANGTIYSNIEYANDLLDGSYKTYYSNGKLEQEGQSVEGAFDGAWKSYYFDGTLQSTFNYKDDKFIGDYIFYDTDGLVNYKYEYRRGEIIAYEFYDKKGKIIKEARKKGGEFYYEGFSPYGNRTANGLYDITGGKEGLWKFYTPNGVIYSEGEYKENKVQGTLKNFYQNGKLSSLGTYENDQLQGYYQEFYKSGQLSTQGYYIDGSSHGEWHSYCLLYTSPSPRD